MEWKTLLQELPRYGEICLIVYNGKNIRSTIHLKHIPEEVIKFIKKNKLYFFSVNDLEKEEKFLNRFKELQNKYHIYIAEWKKLDISILSSPNTFDLSFKRIYYDDSNIRKINCINCNYNYQRDLQWISIQDILKMKLIELNRFELLDLQ